MSNELFRISAKNLGEIALTDFCPRCFWLKRQVAKMPFQFFPGIFGSIDGYTKRVVHQWFDQYHAAPGWLADLGDIVGYAPAPHHSKFNFLDTATNIILAGTPDEVFVCRNGAYLIADYKTAKYTKSQDQLLPLYAAQLNAYALIGAHCGLEPVVGLALIYMEPLTDDTAAQDTANARAQGFALSFSASLHPVALQPDSIPYLLREARALYDCAQAPTSRANCKDCAALVELLRAAA